MKNETPDYSSLRVLVIDDEMMLRRTVSDFLEDIDFEAITAENGREGLEVFEAEEPDAVLVDLMMPEVDGYEVLARVRELSPETPVIVVSGAGLVEDAVKALRLGAWDFVTKPIKDMAVLEHALKKSLERARLIEENRLYREHLEDEVGKRTSELKQEIIERKKAQEELGRLNEELEERVALRTGELRTANQSLSASLEDLKSAQNQLVQAEKMASLGGLVAGVAHEINTPIGIAVTAVSFLDEKTRNLERDHVSGQMTKSGFEGYLNLAGESISSILLNLNRAAELIQSFKQVAVDQTTGEKRDFNLSAYIGEVLISLKPKYKRTGHQVEVRCPEDLVIRSSPGAFMQIITNLVENSLLHGFEGIEKGLISINIEKADQRLVFEYADNGNGMDEERRSKVFEPFFTSRRGRGGTGLGMHIVYNLVAQTLGGDIRCESSPGQGVKFIITMPVQEG